MSLVDHARTELEAAGYFGKDSDYDGMLGDAVMDLIKVFSEQGHSGMSAGITTSLFERLSQYEPLGPITGADSEWVCVAESSGYPLWQNRRCSHVFREGDGKAYDIDAIVFRDPDGGHFTNKESRVEIDFPYTPKRVTVDRAEDGSYDRVAALAAWRAK